MENTHLSFLKSLAGDAFTNRKSLFEHGADNPEGNGFLTFLDGLLKTKSEDSEELVNIFAAQAPGTNVESLRDTVPANMAQPLNRELSVFATTEPIQPIATELESESLQLDQIVKPQASVVSGETASATAVKTLQAAIAVPGQTEITMRSVQAAPGASASKPEIAEIEPPAEAGEIESESRFESLLHGTRPKQSAHAANHQAPGALAIADLAASDSRLHSVQSREDAPVGVEFDRLSSHRVELMANVSDRNIHLNPVRDQIIAAVSARPGENKLEIRLDPPELGKVLIGFDRDGADIVRAVISADSPETLDLMRRHADVFQRALEAQGFENLDLHFSDKRPDENANLKPDNNARSFSLAEEDVLEGSIAGASPMANGRLDRRL